MRQQRKHAIFVTVHSIRGGAIAYLIDGLLRGYATKIWAMDYQLLGAGNISRDHERRLKHTIHVFNRTVKSSVTISLFYYTTLCHLVITLSTSLTKTFCTDLDDMYSLILITRNYKSIT